LGLDRCSIGLVSAKALDSLLLLMSEKSIKKRRGDGQGAAREERSPSPKTPRTAALGPASTPPLPAPAHSKAARHISHP
jgi:hypothetical protein